MNAARPAVAAPPSSAWWFALLGAVSAAQGVVAILVLDLLAAREAATQTYLFRRTISHHALGERWWLFALAVLLLAAGSLAVFHALHAGGLTRYRSAAGVALSLWSVGLLMVALFEKHDWSMGPSPSGYIHWAGSLLAFVSLPVGAMLMARPWLHDGRWRWTARLTFWSGCASLACFLPIVLAVSIHLVDGTPWWRVVPLGLVERLLAVAEVTVVLIMSWWALSATARESGWAVHG